MNAIDVLIKYWGHTRFRLKQEKIIKQVLNGNDTLALLPTAGGKSICFQIPALLQEGICVVISPLISLMDDQVRHLESKGIKSVAITSHMYYTDIDTALTNCIYGGIKFLYLSPEKLQNKLVQSRINDMNVNLIAVDEAHCISEWGHNFRPSYRHIGKIRNNIPETPILALTATATDEVIKDIQTNLLFKKVNLISSSFKRDNLSYVVDNVTDKNSRILKLLNKIRSSVIIYVRSRKATIELTEFLIHNKFSAEYYHAGIGIEERLEKQKKWTNNQIRIIVATNAFGMGINKLDVKLVVHMYLPSTLEAYFQQAGRAGRNEKTAYAFLLANKNDIYEQEKLLELKYPKINEIIETYQKIANYLQIAVGDFPKDPIPFDIKIFSDRYKIKLIKTYHILKYLEKEGIIKLSSTTFSPSKIKFSVSSSDLYKFQITNKYYDSFIKLILRAYNNCFNHFVIVDEEKIATSLKTSKDNIINIFSKLQQLEILVYQQKNNLEKIIFLQARKDLKILDLNEKQWQRRKLSDKNKLNKATEYVTNKDSCRSQKLLEYFGEKRSKECEVCDICIMKKRKSIKQKDLENISNKIKILINKKEMDLLEICNSLENIESQEVINVLNLLFDNDKVTKFGNRYQWKK